MTNILLEENELPPFNAIQADQVVPAIRDTTTWIMSMIDQRLTDTGPLTESNFLRPLEDWQDKLSKIWSPVSHLAHVKDSPELRAAYDESVALISEFSTRIGQHKKLYQAYKTLSEETLSPLWQRAVQENLRSFELSGVHLEEPDRHRFAELKQELADLANKFQQHVLDATQSWHLVITDKKELAGLPESALGMLRQFAEARGVDGWVITLDAPSYLAVMTHAENREIRRQVAIAYVSRASDAGPDAGKWDNGPLIEKILVRKQEIAELLGYSNYAEVSLAKKMAGSTDQVMTFLTDLVDRVKPQAQREFQELEQFAADQLGLDKLQPWDIAWASEKLRESAYAVSDEMLRPYFPVPNAINGLFEVCHRLFGISFAKNDSVETYHPDVDFYDVIQQGQVVAGFYFDLYARTGKRGGAWMNDCRVRRVTESGLQLPVAFLTCNFRAPVADKPSTLSHQELTTLFHEFGHGLHHMLTKVDVADISGINGVAWDAVELPSQFLENYCWQEEALAFISGHVESGEALPDELLKKLLKAKNFQSGMQFVRQLEFSLFDFDLHCQTTAPDLAGVRELLSRVRSNVSVAPVIEENRFECSFSHIFGGGYAAGYYSYKWAEVLSADVFDRFEQEGIFNSATGQQFLNDILSQGGSRDAMELFKAFRGREPSVEALLRHSGIE